MIGCGEDVGLKRCEKAGCQKVSQVSLVNDLMAGELPFPALATLSNQLSLSLPQLPLRPSVTPQLACALWSMYIIIDSTCRVVRG